MNETPLTVGNIVIPSPINGTLGKVMSDLRRSMESKVDKIKMQEKHPDRKYYTKKEYRRILQERFLESINAKESLRFSMAKDMNIPPRYYNAKLSDFASGSFITANHEGIDLHINEDGLMISGGPGSGKTHLACALLMEQSLLHIDIDFYPYEKNANTRTPQAKIDDQDLVIVDDILTAPKLARPKYDQVKFISVPSLLISIKETFDNVRGEARQEEVLKGYVDNYRLLVLDDLASEQGSDKGKDVVSWSDSIIYYIISERINRMNPTIVTSNLKLSEIGKKNPRTASRLGGMNYVSMGDLDRRIGKSKHIVYKPNSNGGSDTGGAEK